MICFRDYDYRVVASFSHQIQSEYYGVNISVSIEDISLEHFSQLPKTVINSSKKSCPCHSVFYFFSCDSKQDDSTTTAHSKRFIELLKGGKY